MAVQTDDPLFQQHVALFAVFQLFRAHVALQTVLAVIRVALRHNISCPSTLLVETSLALVTNQRIANRSKTNTAWSAILTAP